MSAVDTNILVRLIVQDDPIQIEAVNRLRDAQVLQDQALFVSTTVLLEVEWVLRARFKFGKQQVIAAITHLLNAPEIRFEREEAVIRALRSYRRHPVDLADCLHAEIAADAGQSPLHTFDRKASKLAGAALLQ